MFYVYRFVYKCIKAICFVIPLVYSVNNRFTTLKWWGLIWNEDNIDEIIMMNHESYGHRNNHHWEEQTTVNYGLNYGKQGVSSINSTT